MKIKDIFEIARIECSADSNDISDETLLVILKENLREFLSILQTKNQEEHFAISILNDIVPNVYKYWVLEYLDEENRKIAINKILKVRYKWENIRRVDVLDISENEIKNIVSPVYWVSGEDLFVFHNEKEVVVDGIEVIWLTDIPEVNLETPVENIFNWKIFDSRILKLSLKPFLYEKIQNFSASSYSRQEYLKEMKNFINRLWRIKEPIERGLPDLSYYS